MSDANLACRKLAVSHPVLLLRWNKENTLLQLIGFHSANCLDYLLPQIRVHMLKALLLVFRHLPMVAGLLHGRIHLNMKEFRQQNHMTFFSNVLAILELLQPLVFHSNHQRALQDCLLSFMKVLQVGDSHTLTLLTRGFKIKIRQLVLMSFTMVLFYVFVLIVELSKDSFAVGVHQQVLAVHTEIHNARCSSSYSLSTETLRHLAVSDNIIFLKTSECALCAIWAFDLLFLLPGVCVQKTQT